MKKIIYLSLLSIMASCATTSHHRSWVEQSKYKIDVSKKDQFRATQQLAVGDIQRFHQKMNIGTAEVSANTDLSLEYQKTIQRLEPSVYSISVDLAALHYQGTQAETRQDLRFDNFKALNPIQFLLRCEDDKVIRDKDSEFLKAKIKRYAKNKSREDALISGVAQILAQVRGICIQAEAQAHLSQMYDKKPGYAWSESLPFEEFGQAKIQYFFLGWHQSDGIWYAVMKSKAEAKTEADTQKTPEQIQLRHSAYVLISEDKRTIKSEAETIFYKREQDSFIEYKTIKQSSKSNMLP